MPLVSRRAVDLERPERAAEILGRVARRLDLGRRAAANPLDLTPMADEAVCPDGVEAMIEFGAGVVLLGLVPLSEQLDTGQLTKTEAFAAGLRAMASGVPYQRYKAVFEQQGFPVFDGMDMAILGINALKNGR